MATKSKLIGAAAVIAGVGLGSVAGAMFGSPTSSGAAEAALVAVQHEGGGPGFDRGAGLEAAAEAIGISVEDLRAALEDGQTIAQVAEANGVDVQTVIDALVADATARIDERVAAGELDAERAEEIKANLEERMTQLVNGELPPRGPGGGHHRGGFVGHEALQAAAEAIGISEEDLREALRDGQTIAQVAEANGVDVQTVIDAIVAHVEANLQDWVTAFVNGERPADPDAED